MAPKTTRGLFRNFAHFKLSLNIEVEKVFQKNKFQKDLTPSRVTLGTT